MNETKRETVEKRYMIHFLYNSVYYDDEWTFRFTGDRKRARKIHDTIWLEMRERMDIGDMLRENDLDDDDLENLDEDELDEMIDRYIYVDVYEFYGTEDEWNSLSEWDGRKLLLI